MDCWEVLGIDPFSDKKTIKSAYARLLKINRPDDDPEGFKQLHFAYKSALNWVPKKTTDDSFNDIFSSQELLYPSEEQLDRSLTEAAIESLLNVPEEPNARVFNDADKRLLDEIQAQELLIGEDWQSLYFNVAQIIKSKTACNDLKQWRFLEDLASMGDLEFRKAASDQVFEVVAEVNALALDSNRLHIKRSVINYLNTLFSWDKKWQEYQLIHSRKMLNSVYPYLEEAEKPVKGISKKRELYYYRRAIAFLIDVTLFIVPILIFSVLHKLFVGLELVSSSFPENWGGEKLILTWGLLFFLLLVPLQEASKYQATIGKYLLGLQVINSRGDRISIIRSFWRSLLTIICCLGFKVVVFINIILSYWRSEILQDTLSSSYVIMRPGSR